MATAEVVTLPKNSLATQTRFLILDTESVPDGRLLSRVKYADKSLTDEEAIQRAQEEARRASTTNSDFLPVAFQYPVAVCVIRIDAEFMIQKITSLGAPQFRPADIVREFWDGIAHHNRAKLVTFNGRGFDLPLLELAAFRYGCCGRDYFQSSRNRYAGNHLDLLDWLTNFGACRLAGGLNLLSKILGKPGKMEVSGDKVYEMYRAGQFQEINDYCMYDTLDTYFVFLRTRLMTGDLNERQEHDLVERAHDWLESRAVDQPALRRYLENWGDWEPWP